MGLPLSAGAYRTQLASPACIPDLRCPPTGLSSVPVPSMGCMLGGIRLWMDLALVALECPILRQMSPTHIQA